MVYIVEGFANVVATHITSQYIAINLDNKTVSVYTTHGARLHVLRSQDNQTRCLLLWGNSLICGNVGGKIEMWDFETGGIRHILSGHSDSVLSIASISTSMFATSSRDTTVRTWEGDGSSGAPSCVHVLRGHTHPVTSLSFDLDSGLLLSTGIDACRLWRPTGACVAVLSNEHAGIFTSVFASCPERGSMVVTGASDGNLVTWSATRGAKLQTLDGHTAMVRSIIAPRGGCEDLLISADVTGTIIAWRYDGEWRLNWKIPEAHGFSVSAMCVKDNCLLTSGADGRIRIRQLGTGVLLREIEESYDAVHDTAFRDVSVPGKDIVAIASRNGRAILDFF